MQGDRELAALSKRQTVPAAMDLLLEVLAEFDKRVDQKVYSTLDKPLDPHYAVQLVTEKATYEKVRKMLRNIEKRGRAASETLKPMLDGNDG